MEPLQTEVIQNWFREALRHTRFCMCSFCTGICAVHPFILTHFCLSCCFTLQPHSLTSLVTHADCLRAAFGRVRARAQSDELPACKPGPMGNREKQCHVLLSLTRTCLSRSAALSSTSFSSNAGIISLTLTVCTKDPQSIDGA